MPFNNGDKRSPGDGIDCILHMINTRIHLEQLRRRYEDDGYVSPVSIINSSHARRHRDAMEFAEVTFGRLHYKTKVHTILRSPFELATLPNVLDIVERLIGSNILLYNVTYIVKEPDSDSFVSWHQDLTYWGFSHDDLVSMWLALSPCSEKSGCMRMLPGSHLNRQRHHENTHDETNVLFQGQTVYGVNDDDAVTCPLRPGQASFHHGWTLHASTPNHSQERRIGLNVQYLATSVRQTKHDRDTAMLVRGEDKYQHFAEDVPAKTNLEPAAIARQKVLEDRYRSTAGKS